MTSYFYNDTLVEDDYIVASPFAFLAHRSPTRGHRSLHLVLHLPLEVLLSSSLS